MYPFGRKPLRKTTVPITVRRRRYFISRAASTFFGVSGGRRAVLSDSSSIRIKEEKENVSAARIILTASVTNVVYLLFTVIIFFSNGRRYSTLILNLASQLTDVALKWFSGYFIISDFGSILQRVSYKILRLSVCFTFSQLDM